MTTVVIADDQELVRTGLRTVLENQAGIMVLGEAADGLQAVAAAEALGPDVVLMDVQMPVMDGITATRQLAGKGDRPRVLILTTFDLDEYVFEALRAGASGFLLKDSTPARLVTAIKAVAAGDSLFAPSVTRRLVERYAATPRIPQDGGPLGELTDREREVLTLLAKGYSNAEISERLVVSLPTVKTHVGRVLSKLGLRDRVQAVVFAYEANVVASARILSWYPTASRTSFESTWPDHSIAELNLCRIRRQCPSTDPLAATHATSPPIVAARRS